MTRPGRPGTQTNVTAPAAEGGAHDVVTIGETMAALRATGLLRLGGTLRLSVAGAESNVAIGLARLGHAVRWAGCVGADQFGGLVLRTLRAENVDVACVVTDPQRPTGLLVTEPRAGHLVRVSYMRGNSAGSAISAGDVLAALEPPPRILHVTGITPALGPGAADAVRAAIDRAHQLGTLVCFGVNYRSRLWPAEQAREALRPLARRADIVIASAEELCLVSGAGGEPPEQRATDLLGAGAGEVVVTRGAAGAVVVSATGRVSLPARSVPVTDVVGAGDAFTAGYLSGLLDDLAVRDRLARAITTSAFAVATPGDWEGLPTRDELGLLDASGDTTLR